MAKNFGGNINHNDDAENADGVTMTVGSTAQTVLAANADRMMVIITITGFDAWIRLQPASSNPTVRKGILITKDTCFVMPANLYTGEISVINVLGAVKPTFYTVEY